MPEEKITILTLSDHPLSPSGVGTQTRYMIEGLLETGKFKFVSLGGAMKHDDYKPQHTEKWREDWLIFPVDGYGSQQQLRGAILQFKPDILWFMTDPRFYGWLWEIENEVRSVVPMVYYHVWDNYPYPIFNKKWYLANDHIACISKVTHDIVQTVAPEVESSRLQHAVNTDIFKKLDEATVEAHRKEHFPKNAEKLIFMWNNRNARRKQSGTLIWWFKDFLDAVGDPNAATLIMHTEPTDVHGQDLEHIIRHLGLVDGQVMFSKNKLPPEHLAMMYNMADVTINISDAEGFGLATLESLACETPILVNMTGGLQEQVTDGENWFGVGLEPSSKALIGSQDVPYIYEDRLNRQDFVDAMVKLYNMTPEERAALGQAGRRHVQDNYNFETFNKSWEKLLLDIHEKNGSWDTRKNYKPYDFMEIK